LIRLIGDKITMSEFLAHFENASAVQWAFIILLMVAVWFLPVLLAMFFNRKQVKLIAIACVPAGFSVVAWSALLVWSVTGKAVEKYLPKKVRARL